VGSRTEVETGSLLRPGGEPGAPKGAKWAAGKDSPRFRMEAWGPVMRRLKILL